MSDTKTECSSSISKEKEILKIWKEYVYQLLALYRSIHQLIEGICKRETLLDAWKEGVYCTNSPKRK